MIIKKYLKIGLLSIIVVVSSAYIFLEQQRRPSHTLKPQSSLESLPAINSSESFTVAVLPDTQFYSADYPDIFCRQTEWILNNLKRLNIAFVSQLGDIVHNGAKEAKEWQTASRCLGKLDGQVAYGLIPGNHDAETASYPATGYKTYNAVFPPERFKDYAWYKGNYRDNQNNYEIINKNNQELLFLNLEFDPADDVIAWAQTVVDEYPKSYIILTTHNFLPDNRQARSGAGEKLWNKLVYKNCSIKMVWSGHYHLADGENRLTGINSCGGRVEQLIQDYQSRENGGNGLLRLYVFTPADKKLKFIPTPWRRVSWSWTTIAGLP